MSHTFTLTLVKSGLCGNGRWSCWRKMGIRQRLSILLVR